MKQENTTGISLLVPLSMGGDKERERPGRWAIEDYSPFILVGPEIFAFPIFFGYSA